MNRVGKAQPSLAYTGQEWQSHVLELLIYMHGFGGFARVPDEHMGDHGIEAFSFSGVAYQCYADQDSNSKEERYRKQRDKLSADIKKFCDNSAEILKLIGGAKIRRWIFVVPTLESKELVKHAATKTAEVLAKSLPHIASGFKIVIKDAKELKPYERQMGKAGTAKINLPISSTDKIDVDEVKAKLERKSLKTLRAKLGKAFPKLNDPEINEKLDRFLRVRAASENQLTELSEIAPLTHRLVRSLVSAREDVLVTVGAKHRSTPMEVLQAELDDLTASLKSDAPELDYATIGAVATSAVTGWMIRCPLDFDSVDSI